MGNDPETASLPIRVFHAVPEPSFSAAKNSLPGLDFTDVRREAQTTSPAALEGELGKAKPSMVASAVSGSFPFSTHTKWKRTY